jgi:Ni,Fe-hydrogenase III large subunit
MAMHIADTGALCMDVGYQLGQVACEALRTLTINTTQLWCGNRFGKGLIRPFGTNFPLTDEMRQTILKNVAEIRRRYNEVRQDIKNTPSLLSRMEQCGLVSAQQMQRIGGVGQASRASGLARDIRVSHPWGVYTDRIAHQSIIKEQGDVMARLMMRCREVLQAADTIAALLTELDCSVVTPAPQWDVKLQPYMFSTALVEGWRGECCHVAITDGEGRVVCYRVKDPSMHNWLALAIAVRSEGISDFPSCNKSFNLSYCGHDL